MAGTETIADLKKERTKIGNFETPEALAKALEDRSKVRLAERIKEITGKKSSDVQGESVDLRRALQDELTPEEQTEIRDTLPDSGLNHVLTKGMTDEEKKKAFSEKAASGEKLKKGGLALGGIQGIIEKVSNSWEVFGKVMDAKGGVITGIIPAITAALAYFMSGKLPDEFKDLEFSFSKDVKGKVEEKVEGANLPEIADNDKIQIVGFVLSKISGLSIDEKGQVPNILNDTSISKRKFTFVKDYYENLKSSKKSSLAQDLGINTIYKDENIKTAFKIVVEKEKLIDDILKDNHPNWRDYEIGKIFTLLYPILSLVKDIAQINSLDDLERFDIGSIEIDGSTVKFGNAEGLSNKLKNDKSGKYKGLNIDTIKLLKGTASKTTTSDFTYYGQNGIDTAEEKEFLANTLEYGKQIQTTLLNQFGLAEAQEIRNLLTKGLYMSEVLDLLIITGGKTDGFNDLEKSYLYLKLLKIIYNRDTEIAGKYLTSLGDIILNDSSSHINISPGVKDILKVFVQKSLNLAIDKALNWSNFLLGFAKKDPLLAISILGLIGGFTFLFKKNPINPIALKALIAGGTYLGFSIYDRMRKLGYSEEDIKKVKKEIEAK